ncbi:polymerase, nucleotidyl transferase domain-containing protein [Artemisia annua]|uniref:Polymerase, nucleotidyl transferase domain-containing protein n=1 Tax=Artemisia annua TaxID=35608 RepID=A0A2U1NDB1_ARTAN|nr:polymerase, nucleotidyl transferase domain-containing protein [Artemisia annua]
MGDFLLPYMTENGSLETGSERWQEAERVTKQIMREFRPTTMAERKRLEVIDFIEELLRRNLGINVLAYGSVPLKTYLPDGDIDLTVSGLVNDNTINDIASLLESEKKNSSESFVINDVKFVDAKVKLVKCIVDSIVVDISFNQIGALCKLCFLEQIDRVVGENHLFKESIILVKAWCYYESRTLGAHAGLISTYGLEILVLYIFNVFRRLLNGPLSVLYTFLKYFSEFDWDNDCISIVGPVRKSYLPRIVAERPPNSHDLMLQGDFLRYCFDVVYVPKSGGSGFPVKHFNIIDPLKNDNNLGRSVSEASYNRIRSAFGYGAKDLCRILMGQQDNLDDELRHFFSNTLTLQTVGQRHSLLGSTTSEEPLDLTGNWNDHLASLNYARRRCVHTPAPLSLPTTIRNEFHHFQNQMLRTRPPFGLEAPNPYGALRRLPQPHAQRVVPKPFSHRSRLQNPNLFSLAERVYVPILPFPSRRRNNNYRFRGQSSSYHLKDNDDDAI